MPKRFPFLSAETIQSKAWMLWVALIGLLYYPTFGIFPYWDDPEYVVWAASYGGSMTQHGDSELFRPFERYLVNLSLHGPLPAYWLTKSLALLLLFVSTLLVARLAKMVLRGEHPWLQFAIPLLYLAHPLHVITILEMDITSQNLGTFFSLALVAALCGLAVLDEQALTRGAVARTTLIAFGLCLLGAFSKETFLGMIAAAPFMAGIAAWRPSPASRARFALVASGTMSLLTLCIYFAVRRMAGFMLFHGPIQERYRVHFGLNVAINSAVAVGASLFPGSTLKLFVHLDVFYVVLAVSLVLAGLLFYRRSYADFARAMALGSAFRSPSQRILAIFLFACAATLLPGEMINGVISENQTDATISFVLLLALLIPAVMPMRARSSSRQTTLGATAALLGMLGVMMATATSEKVAAAHATSLRAQVIGEAMVKSYLAHPVARYSVCVPPESLNVRYSVFHISDGMLAVGQLYRIELLHPPKPPLFLPDIPALSASCSLRVLDQRLDPQTPTPLDIP